MTNNEIYVALDSIAVYARSIESKTECFTDLNDFAKNILLCVSQVKNEIKAMDEPLSWKKVRRLKKEGKIPMEEDNII